MQGNKKLPCSCTLNYTHDLAHQQFPSLPLIGRKRYHYSIVVQLKSCFYKGKIRLDFGLFKLVKLICHNHKRTA